jgi:hypothetical protein
MTAPLTKDPNFRLVILPFRGRLSKRFSVLQERKSEFGPPAEQMLAPTPEAK